MSDLFPASVSHGRRTFAFVLAATAVLAIAAGVRVHRLGATSLWTDEYLSLECSAGWGRSDLRVAQTHAAAPDLISLAHARPWTDVWSVIAQDENHPPLYFLALRAWRTAFGDSPAALRSLSVVASVAAVGLLMAAGAEAAGPAAGVWAGLIMAVAAPQVREAQDARAYMLVTAVGCGVLLLVVATARRGPAWWRTVALAGALLVMPLLHYMALATVGTVAVYGLVGLRGPARRAVVGATAVAVAAYAVVWGPHLFGQHQRMLNATTWLADPETAGHTWRTVLNMAAVPFRLLIDPGRTIAPALAASGLVVLVVPPVVMWARRRAGDGNAADGNAAAGTADGRPSLLPLLWLWVAVPVLTAVVIDLSTGRQSLTLAKYTLAAAPGLYLMAAVMTGVRGRLGAVAWAPAAACVLGGVLCLSSVYDPLEPDWRPLAQFIATKTAPGDPVVLVVNPATETSGFRLVGLTYNLAHADARRDVYVLDGPPAGAALAALLQSNHLCVIGDGLDVGTNDLLAGQRIDHAEMFVGLGAVGLADRPPASVAVPGGDGVALR